MNTKISKSLIVLAVAVFGVFTLGPFRSDAADAPETKAKAIRVTSLNSGEYTLIGQLGHPLGSYHVIRAKFGMPVPKGRAGNGGRLYLQVLEVDDKKLPEPQWIPYFKSMTLQDYLLPDGTNMFPGHPNTHILNGKTVVCRVYEDLNLLDAGGDVSEHFGNTKKLGFDVPHYETSLGILEVLK